MDITSLIDVMFMLIIFFVLTASFVQGKLDVELPSGKGVSAGAKGAVTVAVEKNGAISWAGKAVSKEELAELAKRIGAREVLVAGDRGAPYGMVAEVLSILRGAGVTSAGLLMQSGE